MSNVEVRRTLLEGAIHTMRGDDPSKALEDMERRLANDASTYHMLPKLIFNSTVPIDVKNQGITLLMERKKRWDLETTNCKKYLLHMYEHHGIQILGESTKSNAMYDVALPEGWSIKSRPDHHMWKDLCNDKGEVVAEIFFKPCCGIMDEGEIRFVDSPFIRKLENDSL